MPAYTSPTRGWLREKIGWKPTGPQQLALVDTPHKRTLGSGGEQSGKSEGAGQFGYERTFEFDHPIVGWLCGETYRDSWKVFDYMVSKFAKLGVLKDFSKGSRDRTRTIELVDGSIWRTLSIGDTEGIGQEAPDIIIVDEAGRNSLEGYHKLRIRQAASGGLLLMIGTMERSQPWYHDLFREWQTEGADGLSLSLDSRQNPYRYQGADGEELRQLEKALPPEIIAERLQGIPRDPQGLIFGGYFKSDFHVRLDDYIPGLPVSLAVDPGYSYSVHAVQAIQVPTDQPIRVIDGIYLRAPTRQMIRIAKQKPWWKDVTDGVIDFAGTVQSEKRPVDVWREEAGLHLIARKVFIMDGIDRFKELLMPDPWTGGPQITMHPRNTGLLSELGMVHNPLTGKFEPYRWKTSKHDTLMGRTPEDRNNHAIKAIIYWMVAKYGYTMVRKTGVTRVLRF